MIIEVEIDDKLIDAFQNIFNSREEVDYQEIKLTAIDKKNKQERFNVGEIMARCEIDRISRRRQILDIETGFGRMEKIKWHGTAEPITNQKKK